MWTALECCLLLGSCVCQVGAGAAEDMPGILNRYLNLSGSWELYRPEGRSEYERINDRIRAQGIAIVPLVLDALEQYDGKSISRLVAINGLLRSKLRIEKFVYDPVNPCEASDLPYLAFDRNSEMLKTNERYEVWRKKVLEWWPHRNEVLAQQNLDKELNRITGGAASGYDAFGACEAAKLRKYRVYGVFTLPALIRGVLKFNNPVLFLEFIRYTSYFPPGSDLLTRHCAYGELDGAMGCWRVIGEQFTSVDTKREFILSWWEFDGERFKVFPDLHEAIVASLEQKCTSE